MMPEQAELAIATARLELILSIQTVHVLVHALSTTTLTTLSILFSINAWRTVLKTLSSTHQTISVSTLPLVPLDSTENPSIISAPTTA